VNEVVRMSFSRGSPQFELEPDVTDTVSPSDISDAEPTMQQFEVYTKGLNKRSSHPGALYALMVLTLINLINYMDRYIPSANKDLIKKDLSLTDAETSLPITAFLVVYMLVSPVFGILADKKKSLALYSYLLV